MQELKDFFYCATLNWLRKSNQYSFSHECSIDRNMNSGIRHSIFQ